MSVARAFDKYEGLGNDFLVLDAAGEDVSADEAIRLCNRRFGVGGDGVLLVLPPRTPGADARMRVVNADGSVPEMCGNGIRCVALRLARARGTRAASLLVDTDAGLRVCDVDDTGGRGLVRVDMGSVRATGDLSLDVDGRPVVVAVADAGNPHAVIFGAFARADVDALGPRIATHAAFPRGINVEFARVEAGAIDLVVWERGVGVTMACGTGACATVAAAIDKGLLARGAPVRVHLPGGDLTIAIDDAGHAVMTGPARHVFSGQLAPR